MSEKERQRIGPLRLVVCGELTLAAAAVQMGISYRQAVRVRRRYQLADQHLGPPTFTP